MNLETDSGNAVEAGDLAPHCRTNAYVRGKRTKTRKPAPRPCARCQAIFTPAKESPKKPARFCSDPCRVASWHEDQKAENKIERLAARVTAVESAARAIVDANLANRIDGLEKKISDLEKIIKERKS